LGVKRVKGSLEMNLNFWDLSHIIFFHPVWPSKRLCIKEPLPWNIVIPSELLSASPPLPASSASTVHTSHFVNHRKSKMDSASKTSSAGCCDPSADCCAQATCCTEAVKCCPSKDCCPVKVDYNCQGGMDCCKEANCCNQGKCSGCACCGKDAACCQAVWSNLAPCQLQHWVGEPD